MPTGFGLSEQLHDSLFISKTDTGFGVQEEDGGGSLSVYMAEEAEIGQTAERMLGLKRASMSK